MAISTMAVWRVRIGGNDLNGGAFDSSIVGAGTDYSDQDAAQLSLSDLATASASAAVSSASGGFTAAMVGNAVRIASGTNFTAGTYFITAVTDSNNATLDRTCCTAAASAGVAKVGGAKASVSEPVARGAVAGNTVMIRGQGSNDPIDIDYGSVSVTTGSGIAYVGYNGRPKLSHNGRCFYLLSVVLKNLFFVQVAATNTEGAVTAGTFGSYSSWAIDCVFDTAGYSAHGGTNFNFLNCSVINTGAQSAAGTYSGLFLGAGGSAINCHVKDQRNIGITAKYGMAQVIGCVVQNCAGVGILSASGGSNMFAGHPIMNNTVHGCGGHGIQAADPLVLIRNNIISGITGNGAYGLYATYAAKYALQDHAGASGNVFYDCTNNSNLALSADDLTVNPLYANAPDDLTPTNTALRYLSGVGAA